MNTQQNRVIADGPQVHQAEVSKQTNEEVEEQEMLAMVSEFECTDLLENSVETATARITQCMGEVRSNGDYIVIIKPVSTNMPSKSSRYFPSLC